MLDRVRTVAFDLEAAFADPDWRQRLVWPVPVAEVRNASRRPLAGLARLIEGAAEPERSILLLAGPIVTFFARQVVDAMLALRRADDQGMSIAGQGRMLRGLAGDAEMRERLIGEWTGWGSEDRAGGNLLRRVGRVASWSPPLKAVRAILMPDATAVSHNTLLIEGARRSPLAIGFHHAEAMLSDARARRDLGTSATTSSPIDGLERKVLDAVLDVPGLEGAVIASGRQLLAPAVSCWLGRARSDIAALRGFQFPSRAIWSATGGKYTGRALGLAAMRQGLAVRRFEHVGTGCLVADGLGFDMTERAVSTEVVVPTPDLARFAERIRTKSLEPLATLIPGDGDPAFVFPARPRPRASRPRVVYATTILRRHMQYHDGLLSDPIYLDWQLRVAEAMGGLPVEARIKPHPESHYPRGINPLEGTGMLSKAPFEALIPETDVFVFDFGQTTTFWKGLATAQPVVYLDLGLTTFQDEVRAALDRRATVVPVAYDDRNRPILDCEALGDAIGSAKPAGEDNPFRRWLGGAG